MTLQKSFTTVFIALLLATPLFAAAEVSVQSLLTTFQACIADAQTQTDSQAMKDAYGACIAQARAQIADIVASRSTSPMPTSPGTCVNIGLNLYPGATDAIKNGTVTTLQNYLIAKGLLTGPANGVYDAATQQAVGQLQISLGIVSSSSDPAYGYFGPKTRVAVACSGAGSLTATPPAGSAPLAVRFTGVLPCRGALDFGDGTESVAMTCSPGATSNPLDYSHTYTAPGTYTAKILVDSVVKGRATVVVNAGNTSAPSATITPSSLRTSSSHPVIYGTAVRTSTVSLSIGTSGNDKFDGTGAVAVTNGRWSVTLNNQTYAPGSYGVSVYDGNNVLLTKGTLVVASNEPLSSDGSAITPTKAGSLRTSHGTWTFGLAYDANGTQILLNGVSAAGGKASWLHVAMGGNVFSRNGYGTYEWTGSSWNKLPLSPDGSTLNSDNADDFLVASDGIWSFRNAKMDGEILLNGAPAAGGTAASLYIGYNGRVYAHKPDGAWYQWNGGNWLIYNGNPTATGSANVDAATLVTVSPTPTLKGAASGVSKLRVSVASYSIPVSVANGTWVATVGTLPAGTYTVKLYNQDDGNGGTLSADGPLVGQATLTVYSASSFSISANPNPCTLVGGQCTSVVSWTAPSGVVTQVWVKTSGQADQLFSCKSLPQTLSQSAPWIQSVGSTFSLYVTPTCNPADMAGRTAFATVTVTGI